MKKKHENWSEYLSNKSATKNPKTFNVTLQRQRNGQYVVVGHQSLMKDKDGFNENWVRVNSRDLVQSITESGITAL
jgi:hypothetical protein